MKKRWRYAILAIFALGLVVLVIISRPSQSGERQVTRPAGVARSADVEAAKLDSAGSTARPPKVLADVSIGTGSMNGTAEEPDILPGHLVNRFHPGLNDAYQKEALASGFQLQYFCTAQLLAAGGADATGAHVFSYEYTDTYSNDGSGFLVLEDVDLTPRNDEAPAFYECLKSQRLRSGLKIPISPEMKVGKKIRLYETGSSGINTEGMTSEFVEATITGMFADLDKIAADNPYRESIQLGIALFRCYQDKGLDIQSQIACLRAASGRP